MTIDGYTETVPFGQFSSVQFVASAIAAKFSLDCNNPVTARVVGANIAITSKKDIGAVYEISSSPDWMDALFPAYGSFDLQYATEAQRGNNQPLTPSLTPSCDLDPMPLGGSAVCSAQLPTGATGSVSLVLIQTPHTQPATLTVKAWHKRVR